MQQRREQTQLLTDAWSILLRYRWRFVLPVFVVTVAVLTLGLLMPRKYAATAVFERRTDMVLAEMAGNQVASSFEDPRHLLHDAIAGPEAIEQLIEQIRPQLKQNGWASTQAELRQLRLDLAHRLTVRSVVTTPTLDRVHVSFISADPQLSQLICNTLVSNYISHTRQTMDGRLDRSANFFRMQVQHSRDLIEQTDNQLLQFEIEHANLLPRNLDTAQTRQGELESQLAELVSKRDAAETRIKYLLEALEQTPQLLPTTVRGRNPELTRLEQQQRDLADQINRCRHVLRMTEQHPELISLQQQLAEVSAKLAETDEQIVTETRMTPNERHSELTVNLTTVRGEHQALAQHVAYLQQQLDRLHAEAANVFAVRSEYSKLRQTRDEARRQLEFWEDNLHKVEMSRTVESDDRGVQLNFIGPARLQQTPVSPQFAQVVAAAIGLGLLAGALAVFFAHRSDDAFRHSQDITAATQLPMFGSISELVTARHRRLRVLRNLVVYPGHAAVMGVVVLALAFMLYDELEQHPHRVAQQDREPARVTVVNAAMRPVALDVEAQPAGRE